MAVTCGFYNALNHDRLYDAIQMSSIFDGIIRDGVFSTIGDSLIVTSPEDGMFVDVGPGRAWFNHTWTLNDTEYPVEAEEAEVVLDRIDAVVLEVNANPEVRNNRIYFVKGTPSSNPVKPTMIHNAEVNQYALAYVTIRAGQTTIFQSDIENVVGTDETPFVTGLLQQVSVEQLLLQWNDDFYRYFAAFQSHSTAEFTTWMDAKVAEYNAWYAAMEEEGAHDLEVFDTWFQHMKDQLDEDAAGHLQAEIDELAEACEKGSVFTVSTEEPELVGRSCVVSQGSDSVTKQFNSSGVAEFPSMPYIGSIHVEATDGDNVAQGEMAIPYFGRYSMSIAFWAATLNISTSADGLIGRPITITKGGVVVGTTSFNASGRATYKVHEPGTYIVSSSTAGGDEYSATVVVTEETAYPVNLGIPSGATATPTDDIQIWLKCASIYDKSYTLLADVLEDYYTCERLFSDSNACDYMARSTSWAAIVTTDASVMEQISKYDYCKNKLLGNGTWATAICASDYVSYFIDTTLSYTYGSDGHAMGPEGLVPLMTSDTEPSGECFASSGSDVYAAFNRYVFWNNHWGTVSNSAYPQYLGYHFTTPVKANAFFFIGMQDSATSPYPHRDMDMVVEGSNDGTNYTAISDTLRITAAENQTGKLFSFNNGNAYEYYRLKFLGINYSDRWGYNGTVCICLQFFGESPDPETDLIHSAANDTVYYYDSNNVERQLCVTDANGNGTVDWSEMEPGIYTFYSTVAKNPDNLSEEYSRTVKITKTTTEVYIMPPNALYWNGYKRNDLEVVSAANGWSGATFTDPTFNANVIRESSNSATTMGVGSKNKLNGISIAAIVDGLTMGDNSYGYLCKYESKNIGVTQFLGGWMRSEITDLTLRKFADTTSREGYIDIGTSGARGQDIYALMNITERELTVFSAANDTIYYLGENNVHIPFAKTDETGSASVDLGLIPQGTYTLYSSVAKDPDNLSNYYSKTVTIGPDTRSVKVMPDGALYWYGWHVELVGTPWKYGSNWPDASGSLMFAANHVQINANGPAGGSGAYGFRTKNPISLNANQTIKVHFFDSQSSSTYEMWLSPKTQINNNVQDGNSVNSKIAAAVLQTSNLPANSYYPYVVKRCDAVSLTCKVDWLLYE